MKSFSGDAIAQILGARVTGRLATAAVTGVSTDSRALESGDCFFAIAGENFDGHEYVAQAFAQGAACAVVRRAVRADGPLLEVEDTIKALGDLARAYRRSGAFKVVAITGSVGKTTTRQIVYHVLSQHFRTHQAKKNFNNTIGLPLTLLEAEPSDEIIVAELGANAPGEIAYLTGVAQPDVAVVTNAHPAHLAGFGDLQTIIREKISIAQGLASGGVLIVNGDIEALVSAGRQTVGAGSCACPGNGDALPLQTFGRTPTCDYRAQQVNYEGLTSTFAVGGQRIHLPLPGPGNVDNALAAWAVCAQFGLSLGQFADALESLPSVSMRAEPVQIGTLTVLNDCYNANPASMKNALAMLSNLRAAGDADGSSPGQARLPAPTAAGPRRLVFICGAMAELGVQTEALHAELGQAIAQAGVDVLLTVGDATKRTAAAAAAAADGLLAEHFDDTRSLCDNLSAFVRPCDIILVKASRTARLEKVVQQLTKDFG
ncbi:MAG: UDP-N-acetylmuramoyl-tripeptide--D-alanyl-D-alanine ligase [Phycisphaerales bacterium]|nr:MAG: UDP-N-acetylmuramoyl-tripeptide--D-alanyl-D-alanine ligase [Phycisphaerales bacterium]